MPDPRADLHRLARLMGVATGYVDGLGREVEVGDETLVAVCGALGASLDRIDGAGEAVRERRAAHADALVAPVVVAWNGAFADVPVGVGDGVAVRATLQLEDGSVVPVVASGGVVGRAEPLPSGYHRLQVEGAGRVASAAVISAPDRSWQRPDEAAVWGVSAHLAALRSNRSRSVGDFTDLSTLCEWVGSQGGELVTVLPLLPTFNEPPAEPSPYSPVSRLFWSELVLDLEDAHRSTGPTSTLQLDRAAAEVRQALAGRFPPDPSSVDEELAHYARFRGAQARLGRDWRRWPRVAREGRLAAGDVDPDEERFHLVAQIEVRHQLAGLFGGLDVRLGLDLAVGVHPEGYDAWSRSGLHAAGVVVGAPPDAGFPSGQSWGFPPVLPAESQREGHRYLAASIAHQAAAAGLLRIDHVMAMDRLYWIPEGMDLAEGTYVDYPREELFAVVCLESHRNRCEIVGENLGTVPAEIDAALHRHRIRGMYLAEFEAAGGSIEGPTADETAMIDTHDTPTLAGWIGEVDIDERARLGLLDAGDVPDEHAARRRAVEALARHLGGDAADVGDLLERMLAWLGRSAAPLVSIWLEDLWLETDPVNIPGSSSTDRPNWQRPIRRPLEDLLADLDVRRRAETLDRARRSR